MASAVSGRTAAAMQSVPNTYTHAQAPNLTHLPNRRWRIIASATSVTKNSSRHSTRVCRRGSQVRQGHVGRGVPERVPKAVEGGEARWVGRLRPAATLPTIPPPAAHGMRLALTHCPYANKCHMRAAGKAARPPARPPAHLVCDFVGHMREGVWAGGEVAQPRVHLNHEVVEVGALQLQAGQAGWVGGRVGGGW